nr:MAG TPA: hypothetical protein [Caudoviricetes sp.]
MKKKYQFYRYKLYFRICRFPDNKSKSYKDFFIT